MSILVLEVKPEIAAVEVTDDDLALDLADGRSIRVPLSWYPRLFYASTSERQYFHLLGDGDAIEWPDLDEHIGIEGLLAGRHSGESQKSLKRWLVSRQTDGGSVPTPSQGEHMDRLIQFLSAHPVVLGDGAMGTMLQAAGLTTGGSPEEWNVTRPEVLEGIYRAYVDAGAQVITTNTFGCNRFRLGMHSFEDRVREFNLAAVKTAREVAAAADHEVLIAGDMGPTGEILFPLGTRMPDEVRDAFSEQAVALAEGGVDFFLVETMSALEEVAAAVEGIRAASSLPIAVTMTFDTHFRTMMGVKPVQAVKALTDMGVRVIGANCGNGPGEIERVIGEMVAAKPDDVFLIAQSNAGLPKYETATKQIHYDGTPEVMGEYALKMKALGINYIGACCGSTPAHIAAMGEVLRS